MKKKFNPELLKEEAKRFKHLFEYDFYQETKELPEYKDLILGDKLAEEEAPADLEPADADAAIDKIGDELGLPADAGAEGEETTGEVPDMESEPTEEPETATDTTDDTATDSSSEDVEVDVTSLVKGSEEAKQAADVASHNSEILLTKLSDLENRISQMSKVSAKIEDLEKEIIKRNPTPVEKLEMRSLSSYPYSQKLTDYWADKEGAYNVMNSEPKKKEYVLTKQDVENYTEPEIKKSFGQPYEEENLNDYVEE